MVGNLGILVATALACTLAACVSSLAVRSEPHLSPDRAAALASAAFALYAPASSSYKSDSPQYVPAKRVWWVFFYAGEWSLDPQKGFVVVIDDRTEKACTQSAADSGRCP